MANTKHHWTHIEMRHGPIGREPEEVSADLPPEYPKECEPEECAAPCMKEIPELLHEIEEEPQEQEHEHEIYTPTVSEEAVE